MIRNYLDPSHTAPLLIVHDGRVREAAPALVSLARGKLKAAEGEAAETVRWGLLGSDGTFHPAPAEAAEPLTDEQSHIVRPEIGTSLVPFLTHDGSVVLLDRHARVAYHLGREQAHGAQNVLLRDAAGEVLWRGAPCPNVYAIGKFFSADPTGFLEGMEDVDGIKDAVEAMLARTERALHALAAEELPEDEAHATADDDEDDDDEDDEDEVDEETAATARVRTSIRICRDDIDELTWGRYPFLSDERATLGARMERALATRLTELFGEPDPNPDDAGEPVSAILRQVFCGLDASRATFSAPLPQQSPTSIRLEEIMTIQQSDTAIYNGESFALAGFSGSGLFSPAEFGIVPKALSSDCGRGFVCEYLIENSQLLLSSVNLWLDTEDVSSGPVRLFGRSLERYEEHLFTFDRGGLDPRKLVPIIRESSDFRVAGLREPVLFSGALLLANALIHEMDVCRGFRPASSFGVVHELIVESGTVVGAFDRSIEIARIRERRRAGAGSMAPRAGEAPEWTDSTFGFPYRDF
ncbi:hypothetical protein [Massilia genomosp. 1]|uniref:Uncharacterized protein n=1 Tax=Massilia genomosp. 1 TaxID=2609280 RepID=A0ABX0MDS9_9BURK|nr:hypothetical protein [Massilia genomosp. 1]NHZ60840.1 hypothetical protein [Massilia genomosp. 1]